MPPLPPARFIQAIAVAGLVVLGAAPSSSRALAAQLDEGAVAADSDLELLERAESGAYQTYWVKFTLRQSTATLEARKDGQAAHYSVDSNECLALWRELLGMKIDTLGDATPQQALPDQSHFTVKYRIGQATGGFAAYGVDGLSDERYRKIVGAILDLADKYNVSM